MALAFGCCYLFGGIEKKVNKKQIKSGESQNACISLGVCQLFFLETESWVLFEFRSTLFT